MLYGTWASWGWEKPRLAPNPNSSKGISHQRNSNCKNQRDQGSNPSFWIFSACAFGQMICLAHWQNGAHSTYITELRWLTKSEVLRTVSDLGKAHSLRWFPSFPLSTFRLCGESHISPPPHNPSQGALVFPSPKHHSSALRLTPFCRDLPRPS